MSFYPPNINKRFLTPSNAGECTASNAFGKSADFVCGSFVRISLKIGEKTQTIEAAKFQTNGCGFMTAAADVLCDRIKNKGLKELRGLASSDLNAAVSAELGRFPGGRGHCSETIFEALRSALADFRVHLLEEFNGEKPLICTCFGVSEEAIEKCMDGNSVETVNDVIDLCRAGGGCGSCQPLIQEMLDIHQREMP